MKNLSAKILCGIIIAVSLTNTAFASTSSANDEIRFKKTELLISQMLEEDGPENGSLWNKENTTSFKWSYINGCMVSAMMQLSDAKSDSSYSDFADNYMSPFIRTSNSSTEGYIESSNFRIKNYALDDINSGKALIELIALKSPNSEKYTNAVKDTLYTNLLQYMVKNKSTSEGNLWHKNTYPYQVWLDGLYMETPFWLEYELELGDKDSFITALTHVTTQFKNVKEKMFNSETGLYYHGYDAQADKTSKNYNLSSAMSWAVKDVGHSSNHWLRATGWFAMSLVDNIEFIQKAEQKYNIDLSTQKQYFTTLYTDLMTSMLKYRDEDTKMWYQVIDCGGDDYNYIETSGSACISYALMKGYNIGIANYDFYNEGLTTFRGICDNKLNYVSSSSVSLDDICVTAGLAGPSSGATSSSATIGPKHTSRDGSYDYYVSEKTVSDDAKGVAPFLFAYCQILKYNNDQNSTFSVDNQTNTLTKYNGSEKTVVVPTQINGVTIKTIGSKAFSKNNIEKVFIPNNITKIENDAFSNTNNLIIYCDIISYSSEFAKDNNISYIYIGDADNDKRITSNDAAIALKNAKNSDLKSIFASNCYDAVKCIEKGKTLTANTAALILKKAVNYDYDLTIISE